MYCKSGNDCSASKRIGKGKVHLGTGHEGPETE
jgi:hypothetical protein